MNNETTQSIGLHADYGGCSVVHLLFDIPGQPPKQALKPVRMPILPPGSCIWCFPVGSDEEADNIISHYSFDERGRVCCHFENSGFEESDIPWLEEHGYVIE